MIRSRRGVPDQNRAQLRQGADRDQTSNSDPVLAGLIESPASAYRGPGDPYLHERMAQTGTPPPIRIAGTGFRGPGKMRKSQCPAYRTQIRPPEFLAQYFQDRFPIAASHFCYVNAVEKVGLRSFVNCQQPTFRQHDEGGLLASRSTKVHRDV